MSLDKCRELTNVSHIKCEEKGKKATFKNPDRRNYFKTRVDGCLVKNATASDWVVSIPQNGDVVVELKGTDVDHATRQVQATARYLTGNKLREGRLACLIVCTQYPRFDTTVQRAAVALAREFRAPLHVVTRNDEYDFECVLSFKGPHKI